MQYREVKDVLEGYVQYIAIMHGMEIKFSRNKRLNQFEYHVKQRNAEDFVIMTAEMGDVREKVVLRFKQADEFVFEFEDTYYAKPENFYPKYEYGFNGLTLSVYDIEQIHKVLGLFEEIGFFAR